MRIRRGQIQLRLVVLLSLVGLAVIIGWTWQSTRPSRPDGRSEIVVWGATEFGPEVWSAFAQFERENPKYKVVASSAVARDFTADGQRLLCAIAGGVPPDLVYFDRFAIGEWAARGALEDLTPWLENQNPDDPNRLEISQYYKWTIDEASYRRPGSDDRPALYGIPTVIDVRILFCNADHLRQQGFIDPVTRAPRPPRNWSELRRYAKTLSRYDSHGLMTRLGFAPNYGNSWLYLYAFQAGGSMLSADGTRVTMTSEPVVRALRFMTDIYDDLGGARLVEGFQKSFQAGALNAFITGRVSMKIDGDWSMRDIADWNREMDFIVTPAPLPDELVAAGADPVTWAGGWSLIIPSTARQKAGAFKLIQFLRSPRITMMLKEGEREVKESEGKLYLPRADSNRVLWQQIVEKYITGNPQMPRRIKEAYEVVLALLPHTKIRPVSPVGQLIWNQHVRAYDAAINHVHARAARDKDDEIRMCLSVMQADAQKQLDDLLDPPPSTPVNWTPWFASYGLLMVAPFGAMWVVYRRRKREYSYKPREIGAAMMFASPWTMGFALLVGGPIIFSVIMSFTRYDVLSPARYVGVQNYLDVLKDGVFYKSLGNTAYMVIRIPLTMALSLGIAMLLNRSIRGIGTYRTAYYMPAIVPLVASSLLWVYVLNPNYGLLNNALGWLISTPPAHWIEWLINRLHTFESGPFQFTLPAWLTDPAWAKPSLILMTLWAAGGGMIIWLAGLQSIPQQLYEAATVDGAGRWRQFIHVTLPMLSPYILFNTIMGLIGTMQIFNEAYIMTAGGPADATLFYAYYLFRQAFQYFRMGYASALAWILFAIVLSLTLLQLWLSKRWVHYERS